MYVEFKWTDGFGSSIPRSNLTEDDEFYY